MNKNVFASAFSDYTDVTNVDALIQVSQTPLRKCIRVNTLKISVKNFKKIATKKKWKLSPVLWCKEGFFIEREDTESALGKDLLHQLGYFYIQEASSMLPVALLDAKPNETILDMSAAPGSKTTQMAAAMNNEGLIIANDIQPKRLLTLQAATYRLGVTCAVLTQKKGQWFGQNMVENFDRVLCDAPCSAQGTVRKDATALDFFSQDAIADLVKIQFQLLESAVHAAKIGGRIVYSTCTLTFQENELLVHQILEKYPNAIKICKPTIKNFENTVAIDDANLVQQKNKKDSLPMLRLWPQTYNTEGFFCAVLEKTLSTCAMQYIPAVHKRERPLKKRQQTELTATVRAQFGTDFLETFETLFEHDGFVYVTHASIEEKKLPLKNYSLGIPYGKIINNSTIRISNELAMARGHMAVKNTYDIVEEQCKDLLAGKNSYALPTLTGDVIICYEHMCLGVSNIRNSIIKNTLDRELIRQYSK